MKSSLFFVGTMMQGLFSFRGRSCPAGLSWPQPMALSPCTVQVFLALRLLFPCHAHAGLEERIQEVSLALAETPHDVSLLVKRARLYVMDEDWSRAAADFSRIPADETDNVQAWHYDYGNALFRAGRPKEALPLIEAYLKLNPDEAKGYTLRAEVLASLGTTNQAAEDYGEAIQRLPHPSPDHYIKRARLLANEGKIKEAIDGLDEGISRLGSLVTLEQEAIKWETALGSYRSAIERLEAVMAESNRKESWLEQKGDLLRAWGKDEEALLAYQEALLALYALPERVRRTPFVMKLEQRVQGALTQLSAELQATP